MAFGDLCTLADVKAWLQTGHSVFPPTDDALLTRLISAAGRFVESWLGRPIAACDWQEVRDGSGGQSLLFACFPVTAVLALTIDGLAIPMAASDGGVTAGYTFTATELALRGYVFTRRRQNVIVTYTAGYRDIPPEVAQACIELVCRRYRERTRIGEAGRALAGSETVTFAPQEIDAATKRLLAPYRAVVPVSGFGRRQAATATDPALLGAAL